MQAQIVIKKMSEMIDSKPNNQTSNDNAANGNNNTIVQDEDNNIEVYISFVSNNLTSSYIIQLKPRARVA